MIKDFHVEPSGPSRYCCSDPAKSNDAERGVMHVVAKHKIWRPSDLPSVFSDVPIGVDDVPSTGKNERKSQVCCSFCQNICRVRDIDSPCSCFLDIDMLKACAIRAYHF